MDLHVFLYDGIVRDKDPADRDAASDVGCYFTVGDQTFTSDILLNTNEGGGSAAAAGLGRPRDS